MDNILSIIRGVSGSAKSTLAKELAPDYNVAADDFPGLYEGGVYHLELQQAAHDWCFEKVRRWMQEGYSRIAVHNTFVQIKYFQPYKDLAIAHGYRYRVIHTEGNYGNVHNVPQSALDRQINLWENYWDGLEPSIKPLKHYAIKYAIHGVCKDKMLVSSVDLSGVPKIKDPRNPDKYEFLFDQFIVDLAMELGGNHAQLPKIWIKGDWIYFQVRELGDDQ
jgi:predicted kinase